MSRRRRRSLRTSARARTGGRRQGTVPRHDPPRGWLIFPKGKRLGNGLGHARGRYELLMFAVVYLLYDASRWVFAGRFLTAAAHARWVMALERSMHVALERSVQRAFEASAAEWVLSNVYLAAQLVVLPASLVWLYRRSPRVYRRLRGTVVAAWLVAVPIFAIFPVAPPRLAGVGLADTVSHDAAVALTGHSTIFYNPYAAVPSLHVGFAFAIGIAAQATFGARWARALALMWGPLVTVSVVATGNHYVFDVVAGLLVTGVPYAVVRLASGRRLLRPRGRPPGRPILVVATRS